MQPSLANLLHRYRRDPRNPPQPSGLGVDEGSRPRAEAAQVFAEPGDSPRGNPAKTRSRAPGLHRAGDDTPAELARYASAIRKADTLVSRGTDRLKLRGKRHEYEQPHGPEEYDRSRVRRGFGAHGSGPPRCLWARIGMIQTEGGKTRPGASAPPGHGRLPAPLPASTTGSPVGPRRADSRCHIGPVGRDTAWLLANRSHRSPHHRERRIEARVRT
jgi:hypothetical protein